MFRFRHPAVANEPAGQFAVFHGYDVNPVFPEFFQVRLGSGVAPHIDVHGGRYENGTTGREVDRA